MIMIALGVLVILGEVESAKKLKKEKISSK